MASFWSFLAMLVVFMAYFSSSQALTSQVHVQLLATISAAPAFLPDAPLSSSSSSSPPSFPPDTEPLFPTPVAGEPPAESSLPTIPASPSPPNPDSSSSPAPGPDVAISPSGSLPASSSVSLSASAPKVVAIIFGSLVFCLMRLFTM